MQARYFVLFIWQDVEPTLYGPYDSEEQRDVKAQLLRQEDPDDPPSGIYPAEIDEAGQLRIDTYSGQFFEPDGQCGQCRQLCRFEEIGTVCHECGRGVFALPEFQDPDKDKPEQAGLWDWLTAYPGEEGRP